MSKQRASILKRFVYAGSVVALVAFGAMTLPAAGRDLHWGEAAKHTPTTRQDWLSGTGFVGPRGGVVGTLSFAVVGDTRPPTEDATQNYPTAIITRIWQDIQNSRPLPYFAITPGNYMFANPTGNQASPQLDLYLTARANFSNIVFPAMGNDECTGLSSSNCGPGNADGVTNNYTAFMTKMLNPIGKNLPYYAFAVSGINKAWTAKFVIVAANAWDETQAQWLDAVLSVPSTYTFVIRNAPITDTTAPCLSGTGMNNADTIMSMHPYTLLIVGHTHTFQYFASQKEVVVGNGGAPLAGSIDYGYVIARQLPNLSIQFTAYDYNTNAVIDSFTVKP